MTYDLQVLADHRSELLLAEVAAWLHMFGKYHEEFLHGNHNLDIKIPSDVSSNHPKLHQLLMKSWPGAVWAQLPVPKFEAQNLSLFDLIKDHRSRKAPPSGLARLLRDAHGRGSGIEKGILDRFAPGQQATVYLATALGKEASSIDLALLQKRRRVFYAELELTLQELRNAKANVDWRKLRHRLIECLATEFRTTVAETRRPLNDVTLFDQTATSVAMFKAALAQNIWAGWREPNQQATAAKYKWRFLRIGINGPIFWGEASRLSDLLARRAVLEKALDDVRDALEVEYPLGAEIYRDENGSIFVVPDLENLLEANAQGHTLLSILENIARDDFSGEACFEFELSGPTRNMLVLGKLAGTEPLVPTAKPEWLRSSWTQNPPCDICPVCGVRPQGSSKKAYNRNVCEVCEKRRVDRSKHWTTAQASTIWTDEIADDTGRLALVVGSFHIENWISGRKFSSILMFDPETRQINGTQYLFDYGQLVAEAVQALKSSQFIGKSLLDRLVPEFSKREGPKAFYDTQVTDSDLDRLSSTMAPEILLVLAMLRQNPSFARIRRAWETTRTFWQEITKRLQEDQALIPTKRHRMAIVPMDEADLDLGPFHTYDLVIEGRRLSVVWDAPNRRLITADNLDYLAGPEQLGKPVEKVVLPGHKYYLEEPTGYGGANARRGIVAVDTVERIEQPYAPVIPILAEPRTFMALVPANRALAVVKAIKTKYETEMGKVRNRLPLTLGVVYAGRRMPLASVLDTSRRLLRRDSQTVQAQVLDKSSVDPWPSVTTLKLKVGERDIPIAVPTVMGDGVTHDVWYPYWQVEGKPTDRNRWFVGPDDEHWVHICDLKEGDRVAFMPSTFDFEYLDTSARRFEVAYNGDGQRRSQDRSQRPYLLEQVDDLEEIWSQISRLSASQIKRLEAIIEAKRRDWGEPFGTLHTSDVFQRFVRVALHEAGVFTQALETAALTGMLADALEIHLAIHKEKLQQENG